MKLYKFRDVNEYSLDGLKKSKLWFNELEKFNDPFEGSHILNDRLTHTTKRQLAKRATPNRTKVSQSEREKMLAEMGITDDGANKEDFLFKMAKRDFEIALIQTVHNSKAVCLSHYDSDPKKDPIYENLMWSHYADGLRGFCIVLDRQILLDYFYAEKLSIRPIPVIYQDSPITLSLNDFVRSRHILGGSGKDMIEEVTQTIGCKSTAWEYEKEFRLLSLEGENLQPYSPEALLEIVIGDKMPEDQRKLVIDTAKSANPDVVFKLAKLKKDSYQLEIIDYPIN
ncbi:DUF2971 domain-containing protein [Vibrio europaeus]|uniref:DUF2971 domain-containing protein n=1 Tax=Vibrio europaeus TaxID=300876 RepID=UPI0018A751A0|nr:DUF2971 domain-containing protein [Vibrio europaeus]MDC5812838.1 DUF2971 domain-containing protein [Vibrio europaeus]QPG37632.1 DUF2971 domain-containing protein [Vibrio europaeus]